MAACRHRTLGIRLSATGVFDGFMRKFVSILGAVALVSAVVLADDRPLTHAANLRARSFAARSAEAASEWTLFSAVREGLHMLQVMRVAGYRPYGPAAHDARAYGAHIPAALVDIVANASEAHGVDPRLVAAVALQESKWSVSDVSTAGAGGVMQLMPETATDLGVSNVFDVRENIAGGTRYLREMLDAHHGNLDLALAAYNAGPRAVSRHRGVPPYSETVAYVAAVKASYRALRLQ
jgi:soluble lytic murein transglycosylase-like protein